VAVPSQEARGVLEPVRSTLADDAVVVSLMKGIELGTGLRMSEVLAEALGIDSSRVVVVSGPNLAADGATRRVGSESGERRLDVSEGQ